MTQALAHGKPFAVVPCCVFAHLSPHRMLEGRPVRSIDEFCRYLMAKDPRIKAEFLPFEGRNKVLYFECGGAPSQGEGTIANALVGGSSHSWVVPHRPGL